MARTHSSFSPSCKCRNIPTAAWPKHPQSYIHQLRFSKKKKKEKVDVSSLPLGPRKVRPSQVPVAWLGGGAIPGHAHRWLRALPPPNLSCGNL